MSQTWTDTIPSSETLATSRTTINNNFNALKTCFIGAAAPANKESGQIWVNTTDNKVYMRGVSSDIIIGEYNAANLGHLTTAGGSNIGTLTLNTAAGATLLGLPDNPVAGTEATSKTYVDLRLLRSGDTCTGPLKSNITGATAPTTIDTFAHKGYVDTKLGLAGGTVTGRVYLDAADPDNNLPGTAGNQALGRDEIAGFTHFHTSSGHRHDGVDARKVRAIELDAYDSLSNQVLVSNGPAAAPTWQTNSYKRASGCYEGTFKQDGTGGSSQIINATNNADLTFPAKYVQIFNPLPNWASMNNQQGGGYEGMKGYSWTAYFEVLDGVTHTLCYADMRGASLQGSWPNDNNKNMTVTRYLENNSYIVLDGSTIGFEVTCTGDRTSGVQRPGGPNQCLGATSTPMVYHYIAYG